MLLCSGLFCGMLLNSSSVVCLCMDLLKFVIFWCDGV